MRSGLEQVEVAAFPGMPPGNFSSTGKGCGPQPEAEDMLLGSPRRERQPGREEPEHEMLGTLQLLSLGISLSLSPLPGLKLLVQRRLCVFM